MITLEWIVKKYISLGFEVSLSENYGKHLGINQKIIDAEPTDGLWNDGRNDTDQLGMSYAELEKAMTDENDPNYQKYLEIRKKNLHKMEPIPVCKFNDS